MVDWPQALKNDLVARRVIVYLGAGVSRNSIARDGTKRPPLWDELLKSALTRAGSRGTRHISQALKNNDYLHACEWLRKRLDDDWIEFLRSELVDPQYEPADIHETIFRLDQRIYLTPNFDNIFENHVQKQTNYQAIIKRFCDPDVVGFLRDDNLHIIKIHGSMHYPNELIFSQKDYAEARVKYSAFYDVLDACLLSHTFLFIGCGLSDPDLTLILENQRFNFPLARPHYLVTSSKLSRDLGNSLRDNRNLKCITYNPRDYHKELLNCLRELQKEIDNMRATGLGS